ncbi:MAG: hypothetical protein JWM95_5564 [Gemmatimonadetes bacterium]|nr:hypothetical protein [Gemmatimonadota bacterium]
MMRRLAGLMAALLVGSAAHAQQKVLLGHAASPAVSVRLIATVGDVWVVGWDRDSVDLKGTVPDGARFELSAGAPAERSNGVKMYVEAPPKGTEGEGRLMLHVPRGARVWVKTGSADIDVTGLTGGLDLNVVGGSITVRGNPKEVRAESMDGDVTIDGAPEWLRVKTATGNIVMHGGQDVGASTISGSIHVTGGDVERAKIEATTGSIVFATGLSRAASVEIETHSGAIDLELPYRADVELDVATITGTIENGWTKSRPVAGRENRGMTLTTTAGAGGGRIVVRSFRGAVAVKGR